MHARYSAEVTMTDHWLGHFLDKAQGLGILDNTMLIVLSDHGHAFGEHGYAGKVASALYPELMDTFFFIRHPGGKGAGERSDHYASTHDVAPTILGSMGVGRHPQMEGQDLSVRARREGARPEAPLHRRVPRPRLGPRREVRDVQPLRRLQPLPLRPGQRPEDGQEHRLGRTPPW